MNQHQLIRGQGGARRGFTLLETLVAVTIIVVAVAGPLVAAGRAYLAATDARNRIVASYLAQEGLEYVRMLRDNTYLADSLAGASDLSRTAFDDFVNGTSGASTSVVSCEGNTAGYPTGGDGSVACALDSALPVGVGSGKALQVCSGPTSCPKLYVSGGVYNLTQTGTPSLYTRSIRFYQFGGDHSVQVVATVSWTFHGVSNSIVLTDYLSPWQ